MERLELERARFDLDVADLVMKHLEAESFWRVANRRSQ
jgi:hypothetical protein